MLSAKPSERYSWSGSPLILVKASTAIEVLSGNVSTDFSVVAAEPSLSTNASIARAIFFNLSAPSSSKSRSTRSRKCSRTARDADTARRTLGLEPCGHIHYVAVDVSAIGHHAPTSDTDAEPDRPILGLAAIAHGNLLLHPHGTAHCAIDAVEHDEPEVTLAVLTTLPPWSAIAGSIRTMRRARIR